MDARKRSARHRRKVLRRGDVRFLLCAGISIVVAAASIHASSFLARDAREQKKRVLSRCFVRFCRKPQLCFFQFLPRRRTKKNKTQAEKNNVDDDDESSDVEGGRRRPAAPDRLGRRHVLELVPRELRRRAAAFAFAVVEREERENHPSWTFPEREERTEREDERYLDRANRWVSAVVRDGEIFEGRQSRGFDVFDDGDDEERRYVREDFGRIRWRRTATTNER